TAIGTFELATTDRCRPKLELVISCDGTCAGITAAQLPIGHDSDVRVSGPYRLPSRSIHVRLSSSFRGLGAGAVKSTDPVPVAPATSSGGATVDPAGVLAMA